MGVFSILQGVGVIKYPNTGKELTDAVDEYEKK